MGTFSDYHYANGTNNRYGTQMIIGGVEYMEEHQFNLAGVFMLRIWDILYEKAGSRTDKTVLSENHFVYVAYRVFRLLDY